jgi:hypothetical protein
MKMQSQALLFGIESSKGNLKARPLTPPSSICLLTWAKSTGKTIGFVTRPFKFGDSTEIRKVDAPASALCCWQACHVQL